MTFNNQVSHARASKLVCFSIRKALAAVDPNWVSVRLAFSHQAGADVMPTSAVLNGPRQGDVDVLGLLPQSARSQFSAFRRALLKEEERASGTVFNPDHKLRLLVGRTEVWFENCESGYVSQVLPNGSFWVRYGHNEPEVYTLARLVRELAMPDREKRRGEAVSLGYFPLGLNERRVNDAFEEERIQKVANEAFVLGHDGGSLEGVTFSSSAEQLRATEYFRRGAERREADELSVQAEAQGFADGLHGKPKAALKLGSSENVRGWVQYNYNSQYEEGTLERADPGHSERLRARAAAQAGVIRQLAPLLPSP